MKYIDIAQKSDGEVAEEVAKAVWETVSKMGPEDNLNAAATLIMTSVALNLASRRTPERLPGIMARFVDYVERKFGFELQDSDDNESKQATH